MVFFLPLLFNNAMFKEIDFKSQRINCRGRIYEPDSEKSNGAGVVLAHGFCGTMDTGLFPYAEAFAKAGFHALLFDYRGFGLSDGTPRQYVSVPRQRRDWARAIYTLRSHANVDASASVFGVCLFPAAMSFIWRIKTRPFVPLSRRSLPLIR